MKNMIFSRLSNTQSAFLIAIILHAVPALIWQFSTNSQSIQWNEGFEQKNLIAVDLGSFSLGGKKGGNGGNTKNETHKKSMSSNTTTSSSATKSLPTTDSSLQTSTDQTSNGQTSNSSGGGNSGTGNGTGTGEGIGNGIGFNGAIQNYQEPQYPRAAIKRNLEGTIKVKINVQASGQLKNFEILQSSGHSILDNAATSAIMQWTFKPHPKNVDYFVLKTIIFSLKN